MLEPNNAPSASASAVLHAECPDDGKIRRRFLGRREVNPEPIVTHAEIDGKPVAWVSLSGRHGIGKSMLLDAEAWAEVSARYGAGWRLGGNSKGNFYIRAGRQQVLRVARQPGDDPRATLSRILTNAAPGEVVVFKSGDTLDLRRSNLLKMTKAQAAFYRAERSAQRVAATGRPNV